MNSTVVQTKKVAISTLIATIHQYRGRIRYRHFDQQIQGRVFLKINLGTNTPGALQI